eukprot:TRINITY_DN23311_c0_g1_i1.p1 TRINITY_DN23311_c0_g1~~TRINITY_DN23311_c0_g1_i1.p1  ORF type:complete len:332 (+),score=62.95 TRINITY_DN23311_c0_g1_i1:55-1050(+)
MASQRVACVLGIGGMGAAMSRRLLECGYRLQVWNRSQSKAAALAAEAGADKCSVSSSPAEAIRASKPAPVLVVLTDVASVISMLRGNDVGASLRGRTLVNLASANPDEGREVSKVANEVTGGDVAFIDGAYCGNPTKARTGTGQLFLSAATAGALEPAKPLLEQLGSVTMCGNVGSSRALDYAVVDLFFANLLSFLSNKEALDREGVDIQQAIREIKKRLDTVPAVLEMYNARLASRSDEDYNANVTVSLGTARNYWASRLPYCEARGIPTHLTDLFLDLLDEASGGPAGPHVEADISRLQECVRYGKKRRMDDAASSDEPSRKHDKTTSA